MITVIELGNGRVRNFLPGVVDVHQHLAENDSSMTSATDAGDDILREARALGVDVLRAQKDGAERLEDADLLDRASALQRVLFTQDDDFLAEGARAAVELNPVFRTHLRASNESHDRPMCSGLGTRCESL
jgi:Domain of unknown function (DUF5615)